MKKDDFAERVHDFVRHTSGALAAVDETDDQKALAEIAEGEDNFLVRERATSKITDEEKLAEIAIYGEPASVCDAALRKISKQSLIAEVAQKAQQDYIRMEAVKLLSDSDLAQKVYADLATNSKYAGSHYRGDAIAELTDRSLLAQIAADKREKEYNRQLASICLMTDQHELLACAVNSPDDGRFNLHGIAALKRLSDQALIAEVAQKANDGCLRVKAAKRLSDPALAQAAFYDIVTRDSCWRNSNSGAEEAVSLLTDQAMLKEIALNADVYERIREKALENIITEDALAEIAINCEDGCRGTAVPGYAVARRALELMHDQALLAQVAEKAGDSSVGRAAKERLKGGKNEEQ